jgi:AraC family transcriptional regulator of arabinose operon
MNGNIFAALTDMDLQLPIYITSVGGWHNQETTDRPSGFPDYQWIQTLSGEGYLETKKGQQPVSKGQGMLLFPNTQHRYYATREPWEVLWVTFNGVHTENLLASLQFKQTQALYLSNPDRTVAKLNQAIALMQSKDPLRSVEGSSLAYEILLDLFMYGSSSEVRSKMQHYEQLEPVLSYIEKHYRNEITLEQLAGKLSVTPQHTCLLFQQTLAMRPFEYITRLRLRKAKELLVEHTGLEIQAIAKSVGYAHASYFIKLFKQAEGITPSTFRSIHRVVK